MTWGGSAKISQAVCHAKGDDDEGLRVTEEVENNGWCVDDGNDDDDCGVGVRGEKSESTQVTTACSVPLAEMGRLALKQTDLDGGDDDDADDEDA